MTDIARLAHRMAARLFAALLLLLPLMAAAQTTTASLSATSLAFGNQAMTTTSATQMLTLTNTGTVPLVINSGGLTLSGTNQYQFALPAGAGTCVMGGTIAAGSSCTIGVQFKPTANQAPGPKSAILNIADNVTGSPQTVALTGTTTTAPLTTASLSATALAFGNQAMTTKSTTQTLTLSNTGTAPLVIYNLALQLGGTNANQFALATTGSCNAGTSGVIVAVGGSCTIGVQFVPTVAGGLGAKTATLSINDNVSAAPQIVALSGNTTTAPLTTASLSATSLAFGNQPMTTTCATQMVTLSNTGTAPLVLYYTAIKIGGTNANQFALTATGTCNAGSSGVIVAVGGNCTIGVRFLPTVAGGLGAKTATLSIADNVSGAPQTVALSGTTTAQTDATTLYFVHPDHLGTPRLIADDTDRRRPRQYGALRQFRPERQSVGNRSDLYLQPALPGAVFRCGDGAKL